MSATLCLADEAILAFVQGALPTDAVSQLEVHLSACSECRSVVAEAASLFISQETNRPQHDPSEHGSSGVQLSSGTQVSRYVISQVIGAGAAGIVYRAYDPELKRYVALKLLRSEQARAERSLRARLLREAQAMARLSHPHVVSVFDVGTFGDEVFVVLELVEGVTLAAWLSEPRSWPVVTAAFLDAGKGLAAAHAVKLVHRDFKPSNVLVGLDGRVRVTDFGLARVQPYLQGAGEGIRPHWAEPDASAPFINESLTRTGHLAGTPMFMAPEQFAGRAADERSDQFAFAVAVYWALYQRHPYLAASARPPSLAELVAALNRAALNVPSSSTVPAALFNVLRTGLAVDPARRFESMQQLLDELARVLRDGGDDRARVSARRRTLIACASSLGVTLAVLAWALARAPGAGPAEVSEAEGARPHGRESIREYSRALTPTTGEPSPVVQPAALSSKVTLEQTTESSAANASAKKAAHTKAQRIQSARAGGPSAATVRKTSVSSGLKQYNNALKDPF